MENNMIQKYKRELPYGKYIFRDGSQLLFNRYYQPLVQLEDFDKESLNKKILEADKSWIYNDSKPPWRDRNVLEKCQCMLKAFGAL